MGKYKYGRSGTGSSDKAEKSRTIFKVTVLTIILLVPAVIYIIISTLPPNPVTGRSIDRGRFDPTVTFTTDWFTFTAPNKWEEAADQHIKDKVYIYRERNGGEYLGLLKIYVNNSPVPFQDYYTRVLPASIEDGNALKVTELQDHCKDAIPEGQYKGNPLPVVQAEVSFTCWADNTNLYAIVGEIAGDTSLELKRDNGQTAVYRITYANTAFSPSEDSFEQVMKTFTAK